MSQMIAAIRQVVTIGSGGRVQVQSPALKEGDRAEVVVFVEDPTSIAEKLSALDRLEKSLGLNDQRADAWMRQVREERQSFGPGE